MDTPFFIQSGKFSAFLAKAPEDIEGAQSLRYRVFYDEMGACRDVSFVKNRDVDGFDDYVEHLVVKDIEEGSIVGTYRLLRREGARKYGSFYTEGEFDISMLKATPGEILEVSRSCVDARYRTQSVVSLLWRGLAEYILHYDVTHLFGCGSFHGTDFSTVEHGLSYLYHYHLLPDTCRPRTLPEHFQPLVRLPKDAIHMKKVARQIPPLIRGYMRLGGGVGDGVFVDHKFNTIDVCIVVDSNCIKPKFAQHYNAHSEQENRFSLKIA